VEDILDPLCKEQHERLVYANQSTLAWLHLRCTDLTIIPDMMGRFVAAVIKKS
jgi:hypothetical protein